MTSFNLTVSIDELKANLKGEVLRPDDSDYESAREIWNGMFDRKPAVIIRCLNSSDVINAVNFARNNNLLVTIKGGGHNSAGNAVCDDGVMIDLSLMNQVTVDFVKKTATVDGGCLLSDVDNETQIHGLAVSGGIISHTGVGGLTLGGGMGWISRKHGFTIDNLLSAEVVTEKGELLTASENENSDLFWAIRGGGGNFGIVTSFEFKCAEIGKEVYSGIIVKKFENAKQYLQFHREYVRKMPDEMSIWMDIRHAPPLPFLPEEVHGKMVVLVPFVWLGDAAEGEKLINPVREYIESYGEHIGMTPWTDWQSGFDGLQEHGARNYWKSHNLKDLSDDCIDQIIKFVETMPSDECEVFIPHLEGVAGRVPETDTAYAHRSVPFVLNIHTRWLSTDDDNKCLAWVRAFHESTQKFSQGVYVNFLSEEGEDRVKDAYTTEVWNRLVEIKRKYDPDNFFRMNQNIKP